MIYSTGRCLIDPNLPVYSFSATPSSAAPVDPLLPFSLFFDLFIFSCFFNSFFSRFESFRLNSPVTMLGENPPPFGCIFSCSLLLFPPLWLPYAKIYNLVSHKCESWHFIWGDKVSVILFKIIYLCICRRITLGRHVCHLGNFINTSQ